MLSYFIKQVIFQQSVETAFSTYFLFPRFSFFKKLSEGYFHSHLLLSILAKWASLYQFFIYNYMEHIPFFQQNYCKWTILNLSLNFEFSIDFSIVFLSDPNFIFVPFDYCPNLCYVGHNCGNANIENYLCYILLLCGTLIKFSLMPKIYSMQGRFDDLF